MSKSYYAVANGRKPGIYLTWDECKAQVHGFRDPIYKKFRSKTEAIQYIHRKSRSSPQSTTLLQQCSTGPEVEFVGYKRAESSPMKHHYNNHFHRTPPKSDRRRYEPARKREPDHHSSPSCVIPVKRAAKLTISTPSKGGRPIRGPNGEVYPVFHTLWTDYKPHKDTVKNGLDYAEDGSVVVYTDGACTQNGRINPCGGMGVFWARHHDDNRSVRLYGRQTNNRAEIQAAVIAINLAVSRGHRRITIRTDSQFLIQSVTQWLTKWLRKGWILSTGGPVANESDFRDLIEAMAKLDRVAWQHVPGHAGIRGNEEADRLAREAIGRPRRR